MQAILWVALGIGLAASPPVSHSPDAKIQELPANTDAFPELFGVKNAQVQIPGVHRAFQRAWPCSAAGLPLGDPHGIGNPQTDTFQLLGALPSHSGLGSEPRGQLGPAGGSGRRKQIVRRQSRELSVTQV